MPSSCHSPQKYSEDVLPEFTPMSWSLQDIRNAIPDHLFVRDTARGLSYLARDILMAGALWKVGACIDPYFQSTALEFGCHRRC
ncbi:hypothetical protein QCA50_002727 [Cerrena zonata]|uniref:Fatty acid desaturase N-terminal domain-containing protein n=1 Tax=Cerrena zonata TaxID=2478898 RepID=A0AAW0GKI3_9APHY